MSSPRRDPPRSPMLRRLGTQVALLAVLACTGGEPSPADTARYQEPREDTTALASSELTTAAARIIAFLRGRAELDEQLLEDSVSLHLAPEGGGGEVRLARSDLRDRSHWQIPSASGAIVYRLVPPETNTELTLREGVHFNCLEYPLATRVPELARLPHVGAKLMPPRSESCLQSWNLTLVYRPGGSSPELTAVVYDQWEW